MKLVSYNDDEIIRGIHSQDNNVILYVYRKNFRSVKHYIEKNSGTEQDAQDVFQDSLIMVYQKVRNGGLVLGCSFHTYLFSVVKILWLKHLDKQQRKKTDIEECDSFISENEGIIEEMHHVERKNLIIKHFNELTEDCKRIIKLFLKGFSISEITKVMDYSSEQHTKNRRFRCKKNLYEKILQNPHYKELANGRIGNDNQVPRW